MRTRDTTDEVERGRGGGVDIYAKLHSASLYARSGKAGAQGSRSCRKRHLHAAGISRQRSLVAHFAYPIYKGILPLSLLDTLLERKMKMSRHYIDGKVDVHSCAKTRSL